MGNVGVLEPWQDPKGRPGYHLNHRVAEDLVNRGFAIWVEPRKRIRKVQSGKLPIKECTATVPKQLCTRY